MKKLVPVLVIALAAAGYFLFFKKDGGGQKRATEGRKEFTAKAEHRDIEFALEISGDVTPDFQVDIKPEVGGKIKKIHVNTGDTVRAGDLLIEIDDTDLLNEKSAAETDIAGAQLTVDKNQKDYARAKELKESKLISDEIFDEIEANLEIARNELQKSLRRLQTAEDRLKKTRIVAPADGTILSTNVIEGQVVVAAASVNSGTTLMTLADLSKLIVVTHINQVDVANLKVADTAVFYSTAIPDLRTESRISFIAPVASIKNNVKGFEVQAVIENPDPRLRPGMTVTMRIPVASAHNALSVPLAAVFEDEKKNKVVYVRQAGTTRQQPVKIGVTNLFHAEILSGLEPGDEVLLTKPAAETKS
jgi:HlyD family secretion protein